MVCKLARGIMAESLWRLSAFVSIFIVDVNGDGNHWRPVESFLHFIVLWPYLFYARSPQFPKRLAAMTKSPGGYKSNPKTPMHSMEPNTGKRKIHYTNWIRVIVDCTQQNSEILPPINSTPFDTSPFIDLNLGDPITGLERRRGFCSRCSNRTKPRLTPK